MVLADVRHATPTPLGTEVRNCKRLRVLSGRKTWIGKRLDPHKLDPRESLADAWKVNFQINSRGDEPGMKVATGCTVLQSQILADAASAWFSRLLRWLLRLCWEDVDVSVDPWPYLEQLQSLRHWCLDHGSLNCDNLNHNCHNASGINGWSMTVARMLVIPLRQRTTHFQ